MQPVQVSPDHAERTFVPMYLDSDCNSLGLAVAGSAKRTEYEPRKWSASADVLMDDGSLMRKVLPPGELADCEALVETINGHSA